MKNNEDQKRENRRSGFGPMQFGFELNELWSKHYPKVNNIMGLTSMIQMTVKMMELALDVS